MAKNKTVLQTLGFFFKRVVNCCTSIFSETRWSRFLEERKPLAERLLKVLIKDKIKKMLSFRSQKIFTQFRILHSIDHNLDSKFVSMKIFTHK